MWIQVTRVSIHACGSRALRSGEVLMGIFFFVGLLWFVHYGMMHFIEKMTPTLSFINNAVSSIILLCRMVDFIGIPTFRHYC